MKSMFFVLVVAVVVLPTISAHKGKKVTFLFKFLFSKMLNQSFQHIFPIKFVIEVVVLSECSSQQDNLECNFLVGGGGKGRGGGGGEINYCEGLKYLPLATLKLKLKATKPWAGEAKSLPVQCQ